MMTVAIAYVMQKVPYVFPLIGGRKVEHLHANLQALDVALTEAHVKKIEGAVPFDMGFPYSMIVSDICSRLGVQSEPHGVNALQGNDSDYPSAYHMAGHFDRWPAQQALRPTKE